MQYSSQMELCGGRDDEEEFVTKSILGFLKTKDTPLYPLIFLRAEQGFYYTQIYLKIRVEALNPT